MQRNSMRFGLRWGVFLLAFLGLALNGSALAQAQKIAAPETLVLPEERALFQSMVNDLTGRKSGVEQALSVLDGVLAKLPRPTKFRGFVQFTRASALQHLDRDVEAIQAAEESVLLLPDQTEPLILAALANSYFDRPERGADFLIRATQKGPNAVLRINDYDVTGLLRRLWIKGQGKRAADVAEALLEIGWTGADVSSRSRLAARVIEQRLRDGEPDRARKYVSKLVVPAHSRGLLVSNDYRAVWDDVEQWAGPRLQGQWQIYLDEVRSRWSASKDPELVRAYADALLSAGHEDTVIRDLLPMYLGKIDGQRDYGLIFAASPVAKALMRRGRWDDLDGMYARLEALWPLGSDTNALNLAGNHASFLLYAGRADDALAKMDLVLADARKRGPEVDDLALATMATYRSCMLYELGRAAEAATAAPTVLSTGKPKLIAHYYLCANDHDRATGAVIRGLRDPDNRDDALDYVQEYEHRAMPGAYAAKMRSRFDAVRKDSRLLAEVAKYGRILPWTMAEAAPPERP